MNTTLIAMLDAHVFGYTSSSLGSNRMTLLPLQTKSITIEWDFGHPSFVLTGSSFENSAQDKTWVAIRDNLDRTTHSWPTGEATWASNRSWVGIFVSSSTRWTLSENETPANMTITALRGRI
jgi:hypothetical protein